MPKSPKLRALLVSAAVLSLATTAIGGSASAAHRPLMSPQDIATMRGYPLSMDKINRFMAANRALEQAGARNPALKAEGERMEEEKAPTLADTIAKLKRHPNIAAYYHKAGLSDLDVAVIPAVVMGAAFATAVPPAKRGELPVSAAQISFVQQHQKEMQGFFGEGH